MKIHNSGNKLAITTLYSTGFLTDLKMIRVDPWT